MKAVTAKMTAICVAIWVLAMSSVAIAGVKPAISFTDTSFSPETGLYSLGWEFTPTSDIYITHLGYYDRGNNGLGQDHLVGIYRVSDQSLLVSTTVSTTDTLVVGNAPDGFFRYREIPYQLLLSGTTYRIAAVTSDGYAYGGHVDYAELSSVSVGNGYYQGSLGSLVYPNIFNPSGGEPYAGPNMLIGIPEPTTLGLLGIGAVWVLARSRRRPHAIAFNTRVEMIRKVCDRVC